MAKYAILATVNRYFNESGGIPPLRFAERDGSVMDLLLRERGFRTVHLAGPAATRSSVLGLLDGRVAEIGWPALTADDLMLFFFAGHGELIGSNYVLHCYGARPGSSAESIPVRDVAHALKEQIRCRQCVCIVDACRNMTRPNSRGGPATLNAQSTRDIKAVASFNHDDAKHVEMIYGCDEGQLSMEDPRLNHGVLTYHLAEVIRERDHLTTADLFDEAADRMRNWTESQNAEPQDPQLYRPGGRRRITLFGSPQKSVTPTPSVTDAEKQKQPLDVLKDLFFQDHITREQRDVGQSLLLKSLEGGLDRYDTQRLACVLDLVEGRLSPADFSSALAAIETPEQESARLARAAAEEANRVAREAAERKEFLRRQEAAAQERTREESRRAAEALAKAEQERHEAEFEVLKKRLAEELEQRQLSLAKITVAAMLALKPEDLQTQNARDDVESQLNLARQNEIERATATIRQDAKKFVAEHLEWDHAGWLSFLAGVRTRVSNDLLADSIVRQLLVDAGKSGRQRDAEVRTNAQARSKSIWEVDLLAWVKNSFECLTGWFESDISSFERILGKVVLWLAFFPAGTAIFGGVIFLMISIFGELHHVSGRFFLPLVIAFFPYLWGCATYCTDAERSNEKRRLGWLVAVASAIFDILYFYTFI
jgi:hypothetical protein